MDESWSEELPSSAEVDESVEMDSEDASQEVTESYETHEEEVVEPESVVYEHEDTEEVVQEDVEESDEHEDEFQEGIEQSDDHEDIESDVQESVGDEESEGIVQEDFQESGEHGDTEDVAQDVQDSDEYGENEEVVQEDVEEPDEHEDNEAVIHEGVEESDEHENNDEIVQEDVEESDEHEDNEEVVQEQIEESSDQSFNPEEQQYQEEISSEGMIEEQVGNNEIHSNEEVAHYEEETDGNYSIEQEAQQEEYVENTEVVEGQEEITEGEDISMEQEYEEETQENEAEEVNEVAVATEVVDDSQEESAKRDSDEEDFDNVVEVEQKVESDAEDENVAQHVSDSENEGEADDKTEQTKLGNVSDDDLGGVSFGSEHGGSDVETSNISPKKSNAVVSSDDEEAGPGKGDKEPETTAKMFDSDSEDEEKEGVGELIADIFGESDDEGEEFTGFDAEEVSKKKKAAVSDDSDDDSLPGKVSDDEIRPIKKSSKKSKAKERADSDSDEGVQSSGLQGMSDFDIMLAKKKEENKRYRRRRDNSTFISDADDVINAMLTKMKEAAESDRIANQSRKPALAKMKMLPSVVKHLKKQNLKELFVDNGVIAAIADWLSLLPDRSLPHITIRTELLKVLHDLPSVGPETLKHSGIGKAVMILFKHPKEARVNRDSAGRLINKWSRPIFGLNENFKSMTREEREQRDLEQMPQAKRRKLTSGSQEGHDDARGDTELGQLRPGEAGFIMRARVPMPSTKDYVVRPKWNIDNDDKDDDDDDDRPSPIVKRRRSAGAPRSSKKDERLDKHIRNFAERRKNTKIQRAVKISIEGNKMSI